MQHTHARARTHTHTSCTHARTYMRARTHTQASLVAAFNASARVKGDRVVQLREILTARGAGFTYSSAYKIEHDIEQLNHIADTLGGDQAREIREEVLPKYEAMLGKIPPLDELQRYSVRSGARRGKGERGAHARQHARQHAHARVCARRTAGLFAFGLAPEEAQALEPYYNRAYHVPDFGV